VIKQNDLCLCEKKKMKPNIISPIAAFDIVSGNATAVDDAWPAPHCESGYRWLHFDLADEGLMVWAEEHLPEIAARALCQAETRPRCERFEDGLILNLRGVNLNPGADPEDMVSLRLWVTQSAIVSARKRKVWAADTIRQAANAGKGPISIGHFLSELAHGLTARIETVSLALEEQADELEDIGSERGHLASGTLSKLRQVVIKMRRFINPQREAIAALASLEGWLMEPNELAHVGETSNRTRRLVEELDATRDRLTALQDSIDAERSHVLGRNSYVLSVVAAIFLPLGFLTGLFGVNVGGMPGIQEQNAFWILAGVSLACGLALFWIFKFAKWL
jgi:zinc transporter